MIKCEKCGATVPVESKFCLNCGSKIDSNAPKHFSLEEIARQQQAQENNAFSITPDTPDDDPETYLPPIGAKEHSEIKAGEIDPQYFNHKPLPNIQAADPLELLDSKTPELPPIGFNDKMQVTDIPEGIRHYHGNDVVPRNLQLQTAFPIYKNRDVIPALTQAQMTRKNIAESIRNGVPENGFSIVPEHLHIRFRQGDSLDFSVSRAASFNPIFIDEYVPERDIPPVRPTKPKTISLEKKIPKEPPIVENTSAKVSLEKVPPVQLPVEEIRPMIPDTPKVSLEKTTPSVYAPVEEVQPIVPDMPKVSLEKNNQSELVENNMDFSSYEESQPQQNQSVYPTFETTQPQQNKSVYSTFGTVQPQQNESAYPSFGAAQPQQNQSVYPSFGTAQPQQNQSAYPSFGTAQPQQNQSAYPSFGTAQPQQNQSAYPSFGTAQPQQNQPNTQNFEPAPAQPLPNDFMFQDFGTSQQSSMSAVMAEERNTRNAKIMLIAAVILIVLLVMAIGVMLLTGYYKFDSSSQSLYGGTSAEGMTISGNVSAEDVKWSNLNNGGLAAEDAEGNVYYSNSSGCICKIDTDGKTSVVYNGSRTNKYIIYINCHKDKVYFLSSITGTNYSICSVDKEGKNFKIYSAQSSPVALFADGDYLYYLSENTAAINRLNIETEAVETVYTSSETINSMLIANGKMYVLCMPDNYESYIEVIDTENPSDVTKMNLNYMGQNLCPATMCCYGDTIFFVDASAKTMAQAYSVNMDGSNIKRLGGSNIVKLAVYGEHIYFLYISDHVADESEAIAALQNGSIPNIISLGVMNLDGSNVRSVHEASMMWYSLAGGRIYYLDSSLEIMSMMPDGTDIQRMP